MDDQTGRSVVERFNSESWHDARLVSIALRRNLEAIRDDIVCKIIFPRGRAAGRRATLIFSDCAVIKADIDLVGKRECGDAIWVATCESALPTKVTAGGAVQAMAEKAGTHAPKWRFHITLIPPGGDLDIIARGFELTPDDWAD